MQACISQTTMLMKEGENERAKILCLLNEALIQKRQLATELDKKETPLKTHPGDMRYVDMRSSELDDREIVSLVADLNQQILDIANDCAELVLSKGYANILRSSTMFERDAILKKEFGSVVGEHLLGVLTKVNHYQNPAILRIVIQAALSNQLHEYFEFWPLPYSHAFSDDFWKLCDAIKANEGRVPADQWRSLSLKYIRSELSLEAQLHNESVNASIRCIAKALRLAGVPFGLPELIKQCRTELGPSIDCLWKSAGIFASKAKEEYAADYQIIFSSPRESFCEERQISYSPRDRPGSEGLHNCRVICTTQVGVQKTLKARRNGHPVKSSVLSRATVALDSEISSM